MARPQRIIPRIAWGIAATVVSGLLSINAFFVKDFIGKVEASIKELTSKTENTNDKVSEVYVRLAVIETKMADLKATVERQIRAMPKREDVKYGSERNGEQFRAQGINQACWR